jgi:hypothetical protein
MFLPGEMLSMSPRNGASSGCGWRRRPPDKESCECNVSRQGVGLHLENRGGGG